MKQPEIHPIRLSIAYCFLVRGEDGTVLMDCGVPNSLKTFQKALNRIGAQPDEIKLILITHGHFDHIGSATAVAQWTGAPVAAHSLDAPFLIKGRYQPARSINPWMDFFFRLLNPIAAKTLKVSACRPEIILEKGDLDLEPYGIPGRIIHTPGHTPGSVSLLLDSGDFIVGDSAAKGFPMPTRHPDLPAIADDYKSLVKSWQQLRSEYNTTVYPAHGQPFHISAIWEKISTYP